jgi:hypothetical protein
MGKNQGSSRGLGSVASKASRNPKSTKLEKSLAAADRMQRQRPDRKKEK